MSNEIPSEMAPPAGPAVATAAAGKSAGDWAPPTGPAGTPSVVEDSTSSTRGWIVAAVLIGVAVVVLVFLAIVSSVVGGVTGRMEGTEIPLYSATRDVSATVLSGYDRQGKPVSQDGTEVLAASVRIENGHGKTQDYLIRLVFNASTGERLAVRNLDRTVPAGREVTRNVFTKVPRPANADVTVNATAERHDPISLMPGDGVPGLPGPGGFAP